MPYIFVWLIRESTYGHNSIEMSRAYSAGIYRIVFLWDIFIDLWLRNIRIDMVDIDKFICSLIEHNDSGGMFNLSNVRKALKEQNLRYDDHQKKIVKI